MSLGKTTKQKAGRFVRQKSRVGGLTGAAVNLLLIAVAWKYPPGTWWVLVLAAGLGALGGSAIGQYLENGE